MDVVKGIVNTYLEGESKERRVVEMDIGGALHFKGGGEVSRAASLVGLSHHVQPQASFPLSQPLGYC
jgi:hypothetical protein